MESVNLLVNSNGAVVLSEVVGTLKMRVYLSGMPECKLGLNDKVSLHHLFAETLCCLPLFNGIANGHPGSSVLCPSASRGSTLVHLRHAYIVP